jgi:hypothetical protein
MTETRDPGTFANPGEFLEMPGLLYRTSGRPALGPDRVCSCWRLVDTKFLMRTRDGGFVLLDRRHVCAVDRL